jgi:DNA uptake protein ComE-like DNA-binding protein
LFTVRIVYPYFISPGEIVVKDLPLIEHRTDSAARNLQNHRKENYSYSKGKLFAFDPNSISKNQLLELGLKEKTAGILIKFREKGFRFRKKEDLKKVFGISDKLYARLEPYIVIENKSRESHNDNSHTFEKKTQKIFKIVELNSADSLQLLEINGIGPGFAKRILKYRSMLGGFIYPEQLKEVYGFTQEMYEKIKLQITVNSSHVQKLDLNKNDFKVINKHPYLSYELTKDICNKRRKGTINEDNLKEIITDEAAYKKLLPYLEF